VVLFAIARYAIDYAMGAGWVLPFTQQSQQIEIESERELSITSMNRLPE
jgi:hypothetical protein